MENFKIPEGYTERANTLYTINVFYTGYSLLGEPLDGKWVIKREETIDDITFITYSEGAWNDFLTLIYK